MKEQQGWPFDYLERNPRNLVAHRFRLVPTNIDEHPGEIPDDIVEYIGPREDDMLAFQGCWTFVQPLLAGQL